VPEIGDGHVEAPAARTPIVIITSNSEKQLPDAFLRRCIYHHIEPPDAAKLEEIVVRRLPGFGAGQPLLNDSIAFFRSLRDDGAGLTKKPSTAELLNWLDALQGAGANPMRSLRSQAALARACVRALAKTEDDLRTVLALLDADGSGPPAG
jgi:MoxR-like ATPase